MARPRAARRVFAVGHFPPPVHGLSVGTERFTSLMEERGEVIRMDISGERHGRSLRHHLVRISRTARAAVELARSARRGEALYLACDAGPGMLYTSTILLVARARGLERFVHHHSYVYVNRRSRLMSLLVRVAGSATTHVVTCGDQARRFRQHYRGVARTRVLPIVYVLDPLPPPVSRPPTQGRPLVLGHLGNLTVEKGLVRAAETVRELERRGLDAQLELAGPSPTPPDACDLAEVVGGGAGRVSHRGAVFGAAKEAFLDEIDVFLFPTLYRNESFGIVAAEAMAHGVPLVAFRAGCLDRSWVGDGGLVLDHDQDFAARAADQVERWVEQPDALAAASVAAYRRASEARRDASAAARALIEELMTGRAAGAGYEVAETSADR